MRISDWSSDVCSSDLFRRNPDCGGRPLALSRGRANSPAFPNRHGCAMTRRRQVYEGKAKVLFEGPEPGTLVQYFKDDATAFNNKKKGTITGKGVLNNRISEYLMTRLGEVSRPEEHTSELKSLMRI